MPRRQPPPRAPALLRRAGAPRRTSGTPRSCMPQPLRERSHGDDDRPRPRPGPGGRACVLRRAVRTAESARGPRALSRGEDLAGVGRQVSELCLGPPRVAGLEVQVRRLDRPTDSIVPTGRRGQLLRAVEKERGGSGRPTPPRMVGCALDDGCHRLIGLVDRRRQLPRPGFGILEQLREPHVDLVRGEAGRPTRTHPRRATDA